MDEDSSISDKVELLLAFVGKDIARNVISDIISKASPEEKKQLGERLLKEIPHLPIVKALLVDFVEDLVRGVLQSMREDIEKQVACEITKQKEYMQEQIVERVKARVPLVAESYITSIIKKKFTG